MKKNSKNDEQKNKKLSPATKKVLKKHGPALAVLGFKIARKSRKGALLGGGLFGGALMAWSFRKEIKLGVQVAKQEVRERLEDLDKKNPPKKSNVKSAKASVKKGVKKASKKTTKKD